MRHHSEKILITGPDPADEIVSLADMKSHLSYEDSDQDDYISALTLAVVSTIDPALGGNLGRALRPQTWELQLHGFPCKACYPKQKIELPFPPLISVVSFKYDDMNGDEKTLTQDTDFFVFGIGGRGKQYIEPAYGARWPFARHADSSVRIRFQSGYPVPDADAADPLPEPIKAYIKLQVADLFANREATQVASGSQIENSNLCRLLDPYRVF